MDLEKIIEKIFLEKVFTFYALVIIMYIIFLLKAIWDNNIHGIIGYGLVICVTFILAHLVNKWRK